MYNESACAFCHNYNYRNPSQYGWGHTNNCILIRTVLKVVEDVLRRNGNIGTPYPETIMDTGSQYIDASSYPHNVAYPTFDTDSSFRENGMDVLTTRMENTYLTPPTDLTSDLSATPGSTSAPYGSGSSSNSEFDGFPPSPDSYFVALHVDGDIRYDEQLMEPIGEPSFQVVPTSPNPGPSIPIVERLEQGTYPTRQPVQGTPAGPVHFNESLGVTLWSLATLANGDEPAFDAATSIREKASIRFELPHFPEHPVQMRVRRGGNNGRPITLREMGRMVFAVLGKLMNDAARKGNPLRHGGSVVDIGRVVLLRVDHVSRGSIQPILGIRNSE